MITGRLYSNSEPEGLDAIWLRDDPEHEGWATVLVLFVPDVRDMGVAVSIAPVAVARAKEVEAEPTFEEALASPDFLYFAT